MGANRLVPFTLLAFILADVTPAEVVGFDDPRDMTNTEALIDPNVDTLRLFAGVTHNIDDNIFRLPAPSDYQVPLAGFIVSRADHLDVTTAGIDVQRSWAKQTIKLDAQIDDNKYSRNEKFNGITGKGKLQLDWSAGTLLTGQSGVNYNRIIPAFQDTLFYDPNIFTTFEYFVKGQFQASPRWAVSAALSRATNSNSNAVLKGDDFIATSGSLGAHFFTMAEDWIGWDYLYDKGQFTNSAPVLGGFQGSNYRNSSGRLSGQHSFSSKWLVNAYVGYLKHETPGTTFATFSGDVWRATLRWEPMAKTTLTFAGWRDITAYLDAQSAFFKSTGYSVTPIWTPRDKITLSLVASHETHAFLGTGSGLLQPFPNLLSREDQLSMGQVNLSYRPRTPVTVKLSYSYQHRGSNYVQYSYNDELVAIDLTVAFMPWSMSNP